MTRTVVAALAAVTLGVASSAVRADEQQDRKDVQQVFDTYIASVNAADLTIAGRVWSQSSDVIAVTPFGRFQGWDAIRSDLYINFLQKTFTERALQPSNVAIHVNGDTAWLFFDWTFAGKMPSGQSIASKGWESHIYRRTPSGWALAALHYSVPPPPPPR